MEVEDFITSLKKHSPDLPPKEIMLEVDFVHNGKDGWDDSDDLNYAFREDIVDEVFASDLRKNRALVTYLLKAEIEYCQEETLMTETLRQLTFMLYSIGEIEDIPLLFEAKIDTSFDASIGLNVELIYGKDKEAVKAYFRENENEDYDIVGYIEEHEGFQHSSPEKFKKSMEEYYAE